MTIRVRRATCGQSCLVPQKLRAGSPRCPKCSTVLSVPPPVLPVSAAETTPTPSDILKKPGEAHVHPVLWASIGGGAIAVLALVIGLWNLATRPAALSDDRAPSRRTSAADQTQSTLSDPAGHRESEPSVIDDVNDLLVELERKQFAQRKGAGVGALPENLRPWLASGVAEPLSAREVYKVVAPAVVTVHALNDEVKPMTLGSGFLLDSETVRPYYREFSRAKLAAETLTQIQKTRHTIGFVITNYHVIEPAAYVAITFNDGTWGVAAGVLTASEAKDLALLLVFLERDVEPAALYLSKKTPDVGERVYAIGSPQEFTTSMSDGIVSTIRQKFGCTMIQTTAPISKGSSGGPLLSELGEVVGVTTLFHAGGQKSKLRRCRV